MPSPTQAMYKLVMHRPLQSTVPAGAIGFAMAHVEPGGTLSTAAPIPGGGGIASPIARPAPADATSAAARAPAPRARAALPAAVRAIAVTTADEWVAHGRHAPDQVHHLREEKLPPIKGGARERAGEERARPSGCRAARASRPRPRRSVLWPPRGCLRRHHPGGPSGGGGQGHAPCAANVAPRPAAPAAPARVPRARSDGAAANRRAGAAPAPPCVVARVRAPVFFLALAGRPKGDPRGNENAERPPETRPPRCPCLGRSSPLTG